MTPEQQRAAMAAERDGREHADWLEAVLADRAARGMRLAYVDWEIVEMAAKAG